MLNTLKSKQLPIFLVLFATILLSGATMVKAQISPANLLKDNVEDLANVDFRTDIRMFVVMTALNAAGFDYESENKEITGVRATVRDRLSSLPSSTINELRLQYQTTNLWAPETTHAAYTSLALLLEGPPEFDYMEQLVNVPHGIDVIRGFEQLLPEFYTKAGLEEMWREVLPEYQRELQLYRPVVNSVIRDTLGYFRIPAKIYFDRNIVIIPDLLAYHDIVNARNVEDVYYIVVGPAEDPGENFIKLQHEYLHFLLDPLIAEKNEMLKKSASYLELANKQPLFPEELWDDYNLFVTESLIESILARLHPDINASPKEKKLRKLRLVKSGMILCPYFERRLDFFETKTENAMTLPLFLDQMLAVIPGEEIKKDIDDASAIQKEMEKEEEQLQEKIRIQETMLEKQRLLNEAGSRIASDNLDAAAESLDKLLEMDPENGKAFFYQAQIAAKKGNWRRSRQLHLKTLAAKGLESWIYAHSLIQTGRINAAEGLYAEARENFEKVLSMEGDLKESRQEAEFLLGKLPQ